MNSLPRSTKKRRLPLGLRKGSVWLSRTLRIQVCTLLQLFPFSISATMAHFLSDCKSRYTFGDVHLGMSCRLKKTSSNLLQQYLWSMLCYWHFILFFVDDNRTWRVLVASCRCFGPSNIVVATCHSCMGMIFDFPILTCWWNYSAK
jgi:hypothetical protein